MWSQTLSDNGFMNDHKLGGSSFGLEYNILIPKRDQCSQMKKNLNRFFSTNLRTQCHEWSEKYAKQHNL